LLKKIRVFAIYVSKRFIKEKKMSITPYRVDSVLNAYARQSKLRTEQTAAGENAPKGKFDNGVSLPVKEESKAEEFDRISNNLRDVILKNNEG
jgi:hypothetical protein